jgi:hypothetical protein
VQRRLQPVRANAQFRIVHRLYRAHGTQCHRTQADQRRGQSGRRPVQASRGDAEFALGANYRENTYAFSPDNLISSGDLANFLPVFGSSGKTRATEAYGELLIPVIKDAPLIREFNIDASYRYSHYNTVGGISTYKVDGDWTVIDGLRLRGGYSWRHARLRRGTVRGDQPGAGADRLPA